MSSSVEVIETAGESSSTSDSTTVPASRRPCSEIALRTASPCAASSSAVRSEIDPLRLADLRAQVLERRADRADLDVRALERLEDLVLGDLVSACLDHRQRLARADDDEVERRLVELLERRVDDELVRRCGRCGRRRSGRGTAAARSSSAAEAPLMQRMSCGVTRSAERTVQMTCTSLRKPFGQSGRIGRSIMRAVSVARSVARPSRLKKPPGIFPAAYIFSSTSTVRGKKSASGRASGRADRGREDHRLARADEDGPVCLLGELARLEGDLLTAHVDGDRGVAPGCECAHVRYPFTFPSCAEGGGLSQPRRSSTPLRTTSRDSLKLPPSLSAPLSSRSPTCGGRAP